MPRFQEVVIPIMRKALPDSVSVASWFNDIDYREYPVVLVRRLGGYRDRHRNFEMDHPVVEMTVIHDQGLIEAEDLYIEALNALFDAKKRQVQVDKGRIAYVKETMGMTQFSSLFQDTYRVQGLFQLGIRTSNRKATNGI